MAITRIRGTFQVKDSSVPGAKLVEDGVTGDKISSAVGGSGLVKNPETGALDLNIDLESLAIFADTLTTVNMTAQGNSFNGPDELVKLLPDGKMPVLDGSNLTGLSISESIGSVDLTDVEGAVNSASGLVKLDGSGKLPTLDGSALISLPIPSIATLNLTDVENNPNQPNGLVKLDALGKLAAIDGSNLTNLPGGGNFVDLEEPAGVKNAINKTFTLTNTPILGSVHFYWNGLLLKPGIGNDYTISGSVITMDDAPKSVDTLLASYRT